MSLIQWIIPTTVWAIGVGIVLSSIPAMGSEFEPPVDAPNNTQGQGTR